MVLYELCRVNNTDFALVHFATETKVDYFPKDRRLTAEQVMNCAETFLNGGTDFVKPLEEVMSIVRNARLKDPDVVFITDGECKLPDNFISVIRKFKALPEMEWSRDIVEQYYRKHPEAKQIECILAIGISSSLVCTYWPGETGWGGSFDKVEAYFRANHGSSQRDCARATGLSPYTDCEAATGYRAYYIKRFWPGTIRRSKHISIKKTSVVNMSVAGVIETYRPYKIRLESGILDRIRMFTGCPVQH